MEVSNCIYEIQFCVVFQLYKCNILLGWFTYLYDAGDENCTMTWVNKYILQLHLLHI